MVMTPSVILAIVVLVAVVGYILYVRMRAPSAEKNKLMQEANNLKRAEREGFASFVETIWRVIPLLLVITFACILVIQSLGYIVSQYFGVNWVSWGFLLKGIMMLGIAWILVSVFTGKWAIDGPPRMFFILFVLVLLIIALVMFDKMLPQLASAIKPFSAAQVFG